MWYYEKDDRPIGPVSDEQISQLIRSGHIQPDTLVWKEPMPDWAQAQTTELASQFTSAPLIPPHAAAPAAPPPAPQPPAVIPPQHRFTELTPLTKWLKALLYISLIIGTVAVWSDYLEYQFLTNVQNDTYQSDKHAKTDADANDTRQALIGLFQSLLFIVSGILFLVWVYRANRNVHALGALELQFTPGWAVGWFFVPIANIWKPHQVMKEICKASKNPPLWAAQKSDSIVDLWWALVLLSAFLSNLSFRLSMEAEQIDHFLNASRVTLFSDIIDLPHTVVTILLVGKILHLQTAFVTKTPEQTQHIDPFPTLTSRS